MSATEDITGPDPKEDYCVDCGCRPKHSMYDLCFDCLQELRQQDRLDQDRDER
jgi:hypothetical protein